MQKVKIGKEGYKNIRCDYCKGKVKICSQFKPGEIRFFCEKCKVFKTIIIDYGEEK